MSSTLDTVSADTAGAGSPEFREKPPVPLKHPARWISAIAILCAVGGALLSVFTNPNFGWGVVGEYLFNVDILMGLAKTIELTVIAMAGGIVLGVVLAVMRLSENPVLRWIAVTYIWFFRGTPVLVQLIFWYSLASLYQTLEIGIPGGPTLISADVNTLITPFVAALLGLALNEAAYMAEIVRSGMLSVDSGQSEASQSLSLSRWQSLRYVVLPQAMRVIIPPTSNETIGMLKATALVSVISLPELLYSAQTIYARNFDTIPLLVVASIWYLFVTSILSVIQHFVELRFGRGSVQAVRLRPANVLTRRGTAPRKVEQT